VSLIAHYLRHQGVLALIEGRVRFARRRFGHYDLIDFVDVLLGYAISGERTLETFYERVQPFANAFMALFGRDRLPARSTLSRFLAALDQAPVEALRTVFLEDLLARPLEKEEQEGGLCGTGREHTTWCSIVMGRDKPLASEPCLAPLIDHPPNVGWTRSALLAIRGASGTKWFGRALPFSKHIRTSGWAPSPGLAMAITEENFGRP
jgi:hypothetical protein